MALHPTPEQFRAEIAKHRLTRAAVCDLIGMNPNLFSSYVNGSRVLTGWAAHNIGWGINEAVNFKVFDVNTEAGPLRPPHSSVLRRERGYVTESVVLPTAPRKRRWRKTRV